VDLTAPVVLPRRPQVDSLEAIEEPEREREERVRVQHLSPEAARGLLDAGLGFLDVETGFLGDLDRLRRDGEDRALLEQAIAGSSVALSAGLSIGYVLWLTRGGLLLASLVSSMPAWRLVDPIPVLASLAAHGVGDRRSGESLDSMVRAAAEQDDEPAVS
jgi:hypothetical protein